MKDLNWDDVRIFLRVAQGGGLSAAAATTGLSPATVGRRVTALEQCIGRSLFVRSQTGYALTSDGRALMEKALAMDASMRPIADWSRTSSQRPGVRVSAGTWTASFLAANIHALWRPGDDFHLCFKTTEARLDLAHREAEIGLRNAMPESGNLAGRKLADVAFAPYRARHLPADEPLDWVAVGRDEALTSSARWVLDQPDMRVVVWSNTLRTLRDLIRAGAGQGVLPCMAGDRDPQLVRAGPVIAEMDQAQYIVAHADDRHRPEVRTVIRRITALVEANAALYRGERPFAPAASAEPAASAPMPATRNRTR
ncbi:MULTISPECIES: LysR family transcriptional regulator [unclassified Roseitalea]|uniref:LysR family transcriptional regulator n=1 Tax=unclassified Roseitalea TaxID=2639107 RepID=UPI00273FAA6B|nr:MULTISPECIES: LysR family transcriptional regulator [unclassified Roseitalea]